VVDHENFAGILSRGDSSGQQKGEGETPFLRRKKKKKASIFLGENWGWVLTASLLQIGGKGKISWGDGNNQLTPKQEDYAAESSLSISRESLFYENDVGRGILSEKGEDACELNTV